MNMGLVSPCPSQVEQNTRLPLPVRWGFKQEDGRGTGPFPAIRTGCHCHTVQHLLVSGLLLLDLFPTWENHGPCRSVIRRLGSKPCGYSTLSNMLVTDFPWESSGWRKLQPQPQPQPQPQAQHHQMRGMLGSKSSRIDHLKHRATVVSWELYRRPTPSLGDQPVGVSPGHVNPFISVHLGCFWAFAIGNRAAIISIMYFSFGKFPSYI